MHVFSDEIEVVCPHCKEHFVITLSDDRQGIKSYRSK